MKRTPKATLVQTGAPSLQAAFSRERSVAGSNPVATFWIASSLALLAMTRLEVSDKGLNKNRSKRLVWIGLCWLILTIPVQAADTVLLNTIQSRLTIDTVIRGDFIQTRQLTGIKKPLVANGTFVVEKTQGVLWRTVAPFPQTTRITQGEILQKDGERVLMILRADQEPAINAISRVLFSLFSGDLSALAEYFDYHGQLDGNTGWRAQFTPRDAGLRAVIGSLSLEGDRVVRQVTLTSAAGDVTRIAFSNVATAAALTADERAQFE
ncbi:MAG: outer membrane lipoprotein carrier protein LolA [Burkholderiales bacterium]|nr:outer membrane lipoprotein carrier protein LolA [Burkholderiales bacterium]